MENFIIKKRKKKSKRIKRLEKYAMEYAKSLSKSEKTYTSLNSKMNIVTKLHSNKFIANQYIKQYLNANKNGQYSFLGGYMKSRSKNIEQRIHLGIYYQYLGDLSKKAKSEKSFFETYKDEVYLNKNDKQYYGMTIQEILEEFKRDTSFTKEKLNKILEEFKKMNEKYLKNGSS